MKQPKGLRIEKCIKCGIIPIGRMLLSEKKKAIYKDIYTLHISQSSKHYAKWKKPATLIRDHSHVHEMSIAEKHTNTEVKLVIVFFF